MPKLIPPEADTIAKYCGETGQEVGHVRKDVAEFCEIEKIESIDLGAYVWVQKQSRMPPPLLDSEERCFFGKQHGGPTEYHKNPDGSSVALCKRHQKYLCESHRDREVWMIGKHGFVARNPNPGKGDGPTFIWTWFCDEHKPNGKLKRRLQSLKVPYTPFGWKWDPQREVLVKA